MPVVPEQKIVIESTFYVTPLVPIMTSNEYFYVLTISKKTIKLFKADAFGMQIVPVELPQGIEEVKRLSDPDATTYRQGESSRRAPSAAIPGQSHGAGGGNPDDKDNIATYFEAVDDIYGRKFLIRKMHLLYLRVLSMKYLFIKAFVIIIMFGRHHLQETGNTRKQQLCITMQRK
jgi:hypothetical protein